MLDPSVYPALAAVSTVLTPTERIRVDAAGEGLVSRAASRLRR